MYHYTNSLYHYNQSKPHHKNEKHTIIILETIEAHLHYLVGKKNGIVYTDVDFAVYLLS